VATNHLSTTSQPPKRLWTIAILVLVAIVAAIEFLNFTGFCYTNARYLTEEELVDRAIQFAMHRQDPNTMDRNIVYGSLKEFHERNPGCCTLSKWTSTSPHPILDRLLGYYVCDAEIYYAANTAQNGNFYDLILSVDACGKVLDIRGMAQNGGPKT
jgi:hypothetical protein